MQHSRFVFCSLFAALLLSFPTWTAAQDSSADAVLNRIAAYLDNSTILVGHFDLKKVDPDKSVQLLRDIVDGAVKKSDMPQPIKDMLQPTITQGFDYVEQELKEGDQGKAWQLFKSSDCEEMYLIVNSMTMAQSPARFLYVFNSSAGTSAIDAVQKALEEADITGGIRFQQKDGLIVADFIPPGGVREEAEKVIDTFDKSRRPQTRPEFLAGMERTKTAPFKLVFAPDAALKGMIQMGLAFAPPEVQQAVSAKAIIDGAQWISLGIDINRWIIDLNIKGDNPAASKALYDAVIKIKDDTLAQMAADFAFDQKAMDEQIMPFVPRVQEDRLRLTINQKFLDDNLPKIIQYALPAIAAAQEGMQFIP